MTQVIDELTLDQMAELFQRNKSTISRHIKNIFETGELNADSTVAFFATSLLIFIWRGNWGIKVIKYKKNEIPSGEIKNPPPLTIPMGKGLKPTH